MTEPKRKTRSEAFLESWPATARAIGMVIGVAEMIAGFVGRPVSGEVLAFAGALIVAPNIAGAQEKRNRKRDGDAS